MAHPDILTKPVESADLLKVVRRVLAGESEAAVCVWWRTRTGFAN